VKKGGPKRSVELMGIVVVLSLPVGFSLGWRWLGLVSVRDSGDVGGVGRAEGFIVRD
jgi:hypothetical protein